MKKFDWTFSLLRQQPRRLASRRRSLAMKSNRRLAAWSRSEVSVQVEPLEDRALLSVVWTSQGPTTVLNGQVEGIANGEVIGAVHVVLPHPTNADIMYLGSVNGGVWKTTNATSSEPTWTPIFDQQTSMSIGAMAMDPANPDRILVGFGAFSSFSRSPSGDLVGLALTEDGGNTWTEFDVPRFEAQSISAVALRGNTMLVALSSFFGDGNPGGLFRSVDGGLTFVRATEIAAPAAIPPILATLTTAAVPGVPAGGVFDLVGDPGNPNRLYAAGTAGIFRTDDTGATWTDVSGAAAPLITLGTTAPVTNLQTSGTNNVELAVHNFTDPETNITTNAVYAVVVNNGQAAGIFRSSTGVDGVNNDGDGFLDEPDETTFVAMDLPRTFEGFTAAIGNVTNAGPIVITSSDGTNAAPHGLKTGDQVQISGVTGTTRANGVFRITVIPGPLIPGTTTNSPSTQFSLDGTTGDGNYTGGGTWQKLSGLEPRVKPGGQGGMHLSVAADPRNPFIVYVGGDRQESPVTDGLPPFEPANSVGATDYTARIFRGDASLTPLGTGVTVGVPNAQWFPLTHSGTVSNSAPHADSRDMVFDATGRLIEADDGGVYRRTNTQSALGDWFSIIGNLAVTEMHDIAYDSNSNTLISGNQDIGTTYRQNRIGVGDAVWNSLGFADGGDVAVDNVTFASNGRSIRYSSHQELGFFKRTVWDSTGELISSTPIALTLIGGGTPTPFVAQFVTPVVLNEINPLRLVLGGSSSVYESRTQGDTITEIMGTVVNAMGTPTNVPITNATAIAYGGRQGGVNNPDVLYVAQGSRVFVRTTAGGTLTQAAALPSGIETITDIVLDPNNWARAWVTDRNQVFQTTDSGANWTDITGSGSTMISAITGHTANPQFRTIEFVDGFEADYLLVGALGGVFVTSSTPASPNFGEWSELGTGLPNTLVWDMDYSQQDDLLAVGTLGRGAWTASGLLRELEPPDPFATALGASGNDVPVGIALAEDGGYAVVGNTLSFNGTNQDIWLSRFDSRGNLLWTRTYEGDFFIQVTGNVQNPDDPTNSFARFTFDSATDIAATPDGGFLITGRVQVAPGNRSDGLVLQVNSVGDVVGTNLHSFAHSVSDSLNSVTENGLVAGSVTLTVDPTGAGISSGFVTYINLNGVLYGAFDQSLVRLPTGNYDPRQVIQRPAGGVAVIGTLFGGNNTNTFVARNGVSVGPNESEFPVVSFGGGSEAGLSIAETPLNPNNPSAPRYLGALSKTTAFTINGTSRIIVRKLDATTLLPVWEVSVDGAANTGNSHGRIAALPDGGFLVAAISEGVSSLFGTGSSSNILLTRLDADGEIVWSKVYGGRGTDGALFLGETLDLIVAPDGYAFTVATDSFGIDDGITTSRDFWVVKTDLNGDIPVMTGLMRDVTDSMTVTPIVTSDFSFAGLIPLDFNRFLPLTEEDIAEENFHSVIDRRLNGFGGLINGDVTANNRVGIVPRVQSTPTFNSGAAQFQQDNFQTDESHSEFVDVIVTRADATHGAYGNARVNYTITLNGSTSQDDFQAAPAELFDSLFGSSGPLSFHVDFEDGELTKAIRIRAVNDDRYEPNESITITLSDADPLNDIVLGTRTSTTVSLGDTTPFPGRAQFSAATYAVNEYKKTATITVNRVNGDGFLEVNYATVTGGTATVGSAEVAGSDFGSVSGTLTFDPGVTSQTFTIPLFDDATTEGDETIRLQLSNVVNGELGTPTTAILTIHDAEAPAPLAIEAKSNGRIAFSRVSGNFALDLFTINPNGTGLMNITNTESATELGAAWSPDGLRLAFQVVDLAFVDPASGIYVANADGSGRTRLTTSANDRSPVWSPDGTRIAYVSQEGLVLMNADGSNADSIVSGFIVKPIWSPDGTHLIFLGSVDGVFGLYEIGVDGFGARRILGNISISDAYPEFSYSPNGTQLILLGFLDGVPAIYRANIDGSGTPERLIDVTFNGFTGQPSVGQPVLSPDGNQLAFVNFSNRITVSTITGGSQSVLTSGATDSNPAWQPLVANVAGPALVTLPGTGSYEILIAGSDLVVRKQNGVELLRRQSSLVTSLNINGSSSADLVTVLNSGTAVTAPLVFNGNDGDDQFNASLAGASVTLNGGIGNDSLVGSAFADSLIGGSGNDTLNGGAGADVLTGGTGADNISGGTENDTLKEVFDLDVTLTATSLAVSQSGQPVTTDTLSGIELANLSGGATANVINVSGFVPGSGLVTTISGSGGNDTITGSSGRESILGGDGDDLVVSGSGNDTVSGDAGKDSINAAAGADSILGGDDVDTINGGTGNDFIDGGSGSDFINGQDDNDSILGGIGNDKLTGSNGNDTIDGGVGNEVINGDAGDDSLLGGDGDDLINGGDGLDRLDGGAGVDRLRGDKNNDVLIGGAGNDNLAGGADNDLLQGGDDADSLDGAFGNDTLEGGNGDDTLRGNAGVDDVDGGAGTNDRVTEGFGTEAASPPMNVVITGLRMNSSTYGDETVRNIELFVINGGLGNDLLDARGSSVKVQFRAGAGHDTVLGSAFADLLRGDDGDDVLSGGASNDAIDGGIGTDTIYESANTNFTINATQLISTATGTETLTSIERAYLSGGVGNNTLNASAAVIPVTLLGDAGNDTLIGGSQDDVLIGGSRTNTASGTDSLTGNGGADKYDNDPADTRVTDAFDMVLADVLASLPSWINSI